jgi:IS5 family transposase
MHARDEAKGPTWYVAMRPGKRRMLNPFLKPQFAQNA